MKIVHSHDSHTQVVAAEKARVDAYVAAIGPAGLEREMKLKYEMRQERECPEQTELINRIPRLRLSDLPAEIDSSLTVSRSVNTVLGRKAMLQSARTAGIIYARLAFDLGELPPHLSASSNITSRMIANVGTDSRRFIDVARGIRQKTGGINSEVLVSPLENRLAESTSLIVSGSVLNERAEDLLDLMGRFCSFHG